MIIFETMPTSLCMHEPGLAFIFILLAFPLYIMVIFYEIFSWKRVLVCPLSLACLHYLEYFRDGIVSISLNMEVFFVASCYRWADDNCPFHDFSPPCRLLQK